MIPALLFLGKLIVGFAVLSAIMSQLIGLTEGKPKLPESPHLKAFKRRNNLMR